MFIGRRFASIGGLSIALTCATFAADVPRGTNLWATSFSYYTTSSPAVDTNGVIYVSNWNGELIAFNPDGTRRWTTKLGLEIVASPAIAEDGTILVGNRNRRLYAVGPDGRIQWSFKTGGWVDSSVAIGADGTIYFGSWDRNFYALTPAGRKKWEFATGGPVVSSPAIDREGTIYFGSHDGRFYALNPDGSKRWDFLTRGQIISSPAIANNGDIVFTSADGRLYALEPSGRQRWVLHTGGCSAASPAVGPDDTIYLGINSNHCAITAEGKFKWSGGMSPTGYAPQDWIASTPAVIGEGQPVVTGTDLLLIVYDLDGKWQWCQSLEAGSRSSICLGSDGTIYASSTVGKLFAFKSSLALATSSWPMFRANPQHTGRVQ